MDSLRDPLLGFETFIQRKEDRLLEYSKRPNVKPYSIEFQKKEIAELKKFLISLKSLKLYDDWLWAERNMISAKNQDPEISEYMIIFKFNSNTNNYALITMHHKNYTNQHK